MRSPASLAGTALVLASFVLPSTAAAAEPNLVAGWPLDTVSAQHITPVTGAVQGNGSAYDGYVIGATSVAGRPGLDGALSFDSSVVDSGIEAGPRTDTGSAHPLETSSLSVLLWVKASTTPAAKSVLVLKSAIENTAPSNDPRRCDAAGWVLREGSAGPEFVVSTGTGSSLSTQVSTASPSVNAGSVWDGKWHSLAGTFDAASKQVTIALDGAVAGSATAPLGTIDWDAFRPANSALEVAHYPNADACLPRRYGGAIDDIRVYDRALSPSELAYLGDPTSTYARTLPVPLASTPATTPVPVTTPVAATTPVAVTTPVVESNPTPQPSGGGTVGPVPVKPGSSLVPPVAAPLSSQVPNYDPKTVQSLALGALGQQDTDILLALVLTQMQSQQRAAALNQRIEDRENAKKELQGQSDKMKEAASKMLEGALIQQTVATAGGAVSIGSAAMQLKSATNAGKLKTTTVALPSVVAPVTNGQSKLAFAGAGSKIESTIAGLGTVSSVTLLTQTATLSKDEFTAKDAEVLNRQTAQAAAYQQQMTDMIASITATLKQLQQTRSDVAKRIGGLSLIEPAQPFASAKPKASRRQLESRLKKLRKSFRTAQQLRDAATRTATGAAIQTFVRAGSTKAPVTAYRVKGCSKSKGCPFTLGG